jgi:hypothetical protein
MAQPGVQYQVEGGVRGIEGQGIKGSRGQASRHRGIRASDDCLWVVQDLPPRGHCHRSEGPTLRRLTNVNVNVKAQAPRRCPPNPRPTPMDCSPWAWTPAPSDAPSRPCASNVAGVKASGHCCARSLRQTAKDLPPRANQRHGRGAHLPLARGSSVTPPSVVVVNHMIVSSSRFERKWARRWLAICALGCCVGLLSGLSHQPGQGITLLGMILAGILSFGGAMIGMVVSVKVKSWRSSGCCQHCGYPIASGVVEQNARCSECGDSKPRHRPEDEVSIMHH